MPSRPNPERKRRKRHPGNTDPSRQPIKPCSTCGCHPPLVRFYWEPKAKRWSSQCVNCRNDTHRRWEKSEKGRTYARNRYYSDPSRKERACAYANSEIGKAARKRYESSRLSKIRSRVHDLRRILAGKVKSNRDRKEVKRELACLISERDTIKAEKRARSLRTWIVTPRMVRRESSGRTVTTSTG